jgi:uncharacterized protein (TIGR04255 family)
MPTKTELTSICYQRNYLTDVIARIDLVSPLPSLKKELPKEISKVALAHFPINEPRPTIQQSVKMSEKELSTWREEFTEWNFHGRNREKSLKITPQSLLVAYKKYQEYGNLREEFLGIVQSFFGSFDQAQPSRLGLRYINELDIQGVDPLDWKDYVSSDLLALFSYNVEGAKPSRIFHTLEVAFPNFNIRFQFGMHNPDYPAPIRRRSFILDYDAYFKGLLEIKDIPHCLDSYHCEIQTIFERSITDQLRRMMNESK